MKQLRILAVAFALIGTLAAQAQVKFGVKGGIEVLDFKSDVFNADNRMGWFIGPTVKIGLPLPGFAIDVAALYNQRESKIDLYETMNYAGYGSLQVKALKTRQIAVPLNVRYGISLGSAEVFAYAGDACLHADIIIRGQMSTKLEGPSGRTIRMHTHTTGNMLAPAFLFAHHNLYPVTIETITDVVLLRLMPHDVESLIHQNNQVAMNFIRILSNNIDFLTQKVGLLSLSVREKVEQFLKSEVQKQRSNRIHVGMSRQELADSFGIQKYSLQRCLSEMQKEGLICLDGKFIEVRN